MTKKNKIGKIAAISTACAVALTAFVGCGSETNEKPEIVGATDFDCIINEEVDLLSKVAALDREDGDITPKMQIKITPEVEVKDGIVVFPEEGDYEITYTVKDSNGNTTSKTAWAAAYARGVYKALDTVDMNGFSLDVKGSAKLNTQSVVGDGANSNMYFETTGAAADTDVVLSRTFTLKKGYEHTISCTFAKSNVSGKAKVKVNDGEPMEIDVVKGDDTAETNTWSFPYDATQSDTDVELKIQLLLGGLGNDIKMEFDNVTVSHEEETEPLNYTMEFKKGNNTHDRFDGAQGSVNVAEGGASATVAITEVADGNDVRWRGGMFLNTGLRLNPGTEYVISYDLTASQTNEFSVMIQDKQWDEHEYVTKNYSGDTTYSESVTITANGTFEDGLWLYVKSGDNLNEITISNLKVEYADGLTISDNYSYKNTFKMFAKEGAPNYVVWKDGKLLFHVDEFGSSDWHTKIEAPGFNVSSVGFGGYYVSFKAKASKPINIRVIGPRVGAWDPTLVWAQFRLTETETLYTIRSNAIDVPGDNRLEWQFGDINYGLGITDVDIEISDITVYYKAFFEK